MTDLTPADVTEDVEFYATGVNDKGVVVGHRDTPDAWPPAGPTGFVYRQGTISYLDTLEIPGFLALNPEFRPASLDQLAAQYYLAWQWLRRDFKNDRHVFSLFDFGRGTFPQSQRERQMMADLSAFYAKLAKKFGACTEEGMP